MDLAIDERAKLLKDRLKKYCQKVRSRPCMTALFVTKQTLQ